MTLERALLASLAVFLSGVAIAVQSFFDWGGRGFGAVDPSRIMRLVIPAVTAMLLGVQSANGAIFVALLQIRRGNLAWAATHDDRRAESNPSASILGRLWR